MSTAILHYIYDPFCGWCYGAAPLVKAALEVLPVHAHGGGMMAGGQRQLVTSRLRDFVVPHDHRIAQLTGQVFGEAYFEGLLRDTSAVFDSGPPIAAMLTAEKIAGDGLAMLSRLQLAHYVQGRRIADYAVLIEIAGSIGLDPAKFEQVLDDCEDSVVQSHIDETRQLMHRLGVHGFPSFALERDDRYELLAAGAFLGRPEAWRDSLQDLLGVEHPR
jgi:putative protein-disulfide isomerase